ncbi:YkgJ family cysteine cluster protein [Fretibacterium sp. OH1220_COT-178]|uniref:YkgJ family cysteine cluster protein n=1 Tax=Fretibacterium sp. OH1220_COT-178 TaxID=2491047 RepID=UPI000F5E5547|nr:YkgJ family cysteine cluster protein [Fretibacterium sp. OH1220_COT-178]RRD64357.1 YkgJ family cysteine cluster protein [Fretibacterium sp. OH1220_COT-178]
MSAGSRWWSRGVRFSCVGCGRCCRGEPGAIFFTREEGARVREFLSVDEDAFRRRFVTLRWGRPSFIERSNGDCIFYRADEARCAVYPVRPAQCRLFPFWAEVMRSEDSWNAHARHCPGMNGGRLYSAPEIEALLREERGQEG